MHELNLIDETFDVNQSKNYFLSAQSSLSGFTYSISDTVRNKCLQLRHYPCKCADWQEYQQFIVPVLEKDANLRLDYKKVGHILCQKEFSIVPEPLFLTNPTELETYFPGEHDFQSISLTTSKSLASKSVIISLYPSALADSLNRSFSNIILMHQTIPFINNLMLESVRSLRHVFHLHIQTDFITLGVAHSGNLDFINTFKVEQTEAIIYFTLSVLERYKASPSLAEIFIMNENEALKDIVVLLQKYIGKVRQIKSPQSVVYSYVLSEEILLRFVNLLNIYNCE